jgi:aspartyl-tRNA(Asn)/glutamyl-tRNA(Gln) amidotransferase subunit C
MSVDSDTVRRIARLARIAVTEAETENLVGELNTILDWVAQLDEVDVDGVEPMTSVVHHAIKMRDDAVTDGGYPDDILENAPEAEDGYFVVPKVVE